MLQVIKRMKCMIKILLNVISRPTHKKQCTDLLQGYIYIVENLITGTIHIGSSISVNKIDDIKHTYYKSSKFKLTIVKQTRSTTHKQRQKVLSELKQTYYNMYSKKYAVVMQI